MGEVVGARLKGRGQAFQVLRTFAVAQPGPGGEGVGRRTDGRVDVGWNAVCDFGIRPGGGRVEYFAPAPAGGGVAGAAADDVRIASHPASLPAPAETVRTG